ncbi:hemerythrin domain-containing protein [Azohydromonas sp.]|uniref:hemerythrin domain-containing protein n=1 Tax=Azohydromonas sp. TaxID=1872666 RepID=UPI002CC27C3C|nr:hemerythrin domain-containing protein [Azohydromonas sp.]HMM85180.1 hemerythrin domain-containing protein [Azohydromonas sp.]
MNEHRAHSAELPGVHSPAAGFDQPFAVLDACHDRVRRSLDLLQRLTVHVAEHGGDAAARGAAHDVWRYFSLAAPAHHEDEERHVLPLLEASGDAALQALARRILDDHARIRATWAALAPRLQALHAGESVDAGALRDAADAFVRAHEGHLEREDGQAFPAAQRLAERRAGALQAMGREMAERRGVAMHAAR